MNQPLARIPLSRAPASAAREAPEIRPELSSREKAAIIVRLLLAEGAPLKLTALPEHLQAALTEQMANMRMVDQATLGRVVKEFLDQLESVGLSFPGGLENALSLLDGHISPSAASRLRRLAGASGKVDPWERIVPLPADRILPILESEAVEIGAVVLSKLPVQRAADLLGRLPGEKARRIAHAVSLTGNIDPDTVRRIGLSLAAQLDVQPPRAFDTAPVNRVGAILNVSTPAVRDAVLGGLEGDDAAFAEQVRRAIFTFVHIPQRIEPRDVPKLLRAVDQATLVTALLGATGDLAPVADYILSNLSQRMAQSLREEMEARGRVREKEAQQAQAALIEGIRAMEGAGELTFASEGEEEE